VTLYFRPCSMPLFNLICLQEIWILVKIRVAIPAANPPDNAIDLTDPTSCRASHCGLRKDEMTQRKGLDVPMCNKLPVGVVTGLDQWETVARIPRLGLP
jgi:hypothetical protein